MSSAHPVTIGGFYEVLFKFKDCYIMYRNPFIHRQFKCYNLLKKFSNKTNDKRN